MKYTLPALMLMLASAFVHAQTRSATCPFGDNANPCHRAMDSLKNRFTVPASYTTYSFQQYASLQLAPQGDSIPALSQGIAITGYVLEVQDGGIESCNCHSKINRDTHIYLVGSPAETSKAAAIIVEITPAFRQLLGSTAALRRLIGHRVTIYGYPFPDDEHKANSEVDQGKGLHWRHTIWEVHPVTKIVESSDTRY